MRKYLVLALVICLCAAATLARAENGVPSLVGIWTCKTSMHSQAKGFLTGSWKWVVDEQKDHVFHGTLDFTESDDNVGSVTFSGVISPNDKKVYVIYEGDKISFGDIIAKDKLVMHTLSGGKEHAAAYCILTRQK
jgi:hypothetical protein